MNRTAFLPGESRLVRLGFAAVMLWAISPVCSQETTPKGPLVAAPVNASWTVEMKTSGTSNGAGSIRSESEMQGDLKRDVIVVSGADRREIWYREGMVLLSSEDQNYAVVVDPRSEDSAFASNLLISAGYPGVSWIDAASFRGFAEQEGVRCLLFEKNGVAPLRAWIEESSRRPVLVQMGDITLQYVHRTPSSQPLVMPSAFQDAWKRYRALAARRKAIESAK